MKLSDEVQWLIQWVFAFTEAKKYPLITPESLLYGMAQSPYFRDAYGACGGNIDELMLDLQGYLEQYLSPGERAGERSDEGSGKEIEFSVSAAEMLSYAELHLRYSGRDVMKLSHLIHAMWTLKDSYAVYFMEKGGVGEVDLTREMMELEEALEETVEADDPDGLFEVADPDDYVPNEGGPDGYGPEADDPDEDSPDRGRSWPGGNSSGKRRREPGNADKEDAPVGDFAPCLNDILRKNAGSVNPLIGREEELERTIQVLCRKEKNNPLHIGEPGVGKTAITYGLVQRIEEGNVPEPLLGCRVFMLDLGGMLAGTQYRGDFEKRFKKMMKKIGKEKRPVIFIDEIHNLVHAGAVEGGSNDAANLLKPYLMDGHIRFIGATTFEEYKKYFEKQKSLVRRFQNIEIREPGREETVKILEGLKPGYEAFHGVRYEDGVLEYIVEMSARHIHERFLPDKAIDILDETGAFRKLHPLEGEEALVVGKDVVNQVLTSICRVPVETVETETVAGLSDLEERIRSQVFGQDEAVSQVVNAVKFSKAGLLEENKPLASLLFVGPTGVGKTEIAKCLAKELGVKLIRFDMSEYAEKHTVAKLIGAPAGYVGYEEGGILTEEIRKNPSSVLLLDEIEKAHAGIYNVLLQMMDYATLTDNQGRKADFRNVVIIMTSNAGADQLGKMTIGFRSESKNEAAIEEAVKRTFQPEFRNRLTKIVVFREMDDEMAQLVVRKKLGELAAMLERRNIRFTAEKTAEELIREKGISREFGAREVERVIRNEVKPLLVDDILFGELRNGGRVILSADDGAFHMEVLGR